MPDIDAPTSHLLSPPPAAGLLRRLIAGVYDGFLLFAVLFAAGALYAWVYGLIAPANATHFSTGDVTHELEPIAQGWLYSIYLLLVIIGFYAAFWSIKGQTLGMQAWRVKLQHAQGQELTFWGAAWRALISLATGGPLGLLWIIIDRKQRSLADVICNTTMIYLPKTS